MKIERFEIFNFRFPFLNNQELGFAVPANSQEEAAHILLDWFNKANIELSMMFPKVAAPKTSEVVLPPQTEFNKLQTTHLDELMAEIAKWRVLEGSRDETIKKWTELEAIPENFKEIVNRLNILLNTYKNNVTRVDSTDSHGEVISKKK